MKRYVLLIFSLMLFSATITAQDGISIKAFDEVSHDLDARVNYPKTDQNGKTCALVKVVTTEGDFTFDNGQLGVVAAIHKPELAEWWVYLPEKTMKLKIMHPVYGQLRDGEMGYYYFPNSLRSATTYRLELTTQRKIVTYEPAPIDRQEEVTPSTPTPAETILQPKWSAEVTPKQKQVLEKLINNMVKVEGGTFMMGATPEQEKDARKDEYPVHQVALSDYYIGKYEVTQEEWEAVMGNNPSWKKRLNLPVYLISWDDCQVFIARLNELTGLNFSLPTEAQWEYAARGGKKSKGYKYAGSNNLEEINDGKFRPVGTKSPNELGLYDMSGNVGEWCNDWYDKEYYKSSPKENPIGPLKGSNRVFRGGSIGTYEKWLRVSHRLRDYLGCKNALFVGFRLACNIK